MSVNKILAGPTRVWNGLWGDYMPVPPAAFTLFLVLLAAERASGKGPCQKYFGNEVLSGATTVLDPDVHEGFPFGFESFIHHVGKGSVCISPGPPQGCHRYYVVSYDSTACPASCPLINGQGPSMAGKIDANHSFDRANGILKACAACAKNVTIACWHAPASEPVRCSCPGSRWTALSVPRVQPSASYLMRALFGVGSRYDSSQRK